MAETATRRAQNNKKRRTCACMIHLQIWLAMPPAPRTDGPGCSTRPSPRGRFLRDGLPLANLGYAIGRSGAEMNSTKTFVLEAHLMVCLLRYERPDLVT